MAQTLRSNYHGAVTNVHTIQGKEKLAFLVFTSNGSALSLLPGEMLHHEDSSLTTS